MYANKKGSEEIVRTLLECRADVNAQSNVRNQMMMMIIIIIIFVLVLTIMMMVNR
jgi:heme/copper-type cytochrome/quinol oxidase subunit 2